MYALMERGRSEVMEFLDDPKNKQARGRYLATVMRLANMELIPGERYHKLNKHKNRDTGLSELKDNSSKTRIISFEHYHEQGNKKESRIILTHVFQKKEDKLDPAQIEVALGKREYYLRHCYDNTFTIQRR